jgi:glycogen debranching enzyme
MITNKNLAEKCIDRAKKLKTKFNKKFWSKKNNFYILALDKDKKPIDRITSNPGHLIFTGIVTKNKTDKIVKRLFQKDMLTKYGIRTYSSKEKEFETLSYHMGTVWPHDNWIIAQGLRQKGYNKEYNKIKKSILKAKKEIGFLPELYGVDTNNNIVKYRDACYPQAWASGSVLSFLLD